MIARLIHRPLFWAAALVLALIAGTGLYWFQPWKLATDTVVDEALPAATEAGPAASGAGPAASGAGPAAPEGGSAAPRSSASVRPAGPVVVRQGDFVSHEHSTTGRARLTRGVDGSYALQLVDLDTSNGPDLRVWLSDQPVRGGASGWGVFDDGKWVELGRLKGNKGDQVYAVPAGTPIDRFASVAIWCKRFSVSFGAAALAPAG